jgi:hypothetical protein
MTKFRIDWTTELWHTMVVEADSKEEAEKVWSNSGMLFSEETVYDRDYIPEDSIEIAEEKEDD